MLRKSFDFMPVYEIRDSIFFNFESVHSLGNFKLISLTSKVRL